ncbi:unnamed protein product [Adineta steineri]|uniref:Flavin-containing monooxygenase n=2 Tax=Adineta steineri TaxID=433720 RepID=A0A813NLQ4_9BILA|nr:unnamed protein product [Adineta steineri]
MARKSVAIIGAGVSGLAAGKVLLEDGFDITIFDRHKTLGGIWSPDWAYVHQHTQTIANLMEFSNLHDTEAMDCAPWENIHNYLKRYADKFHLIERIRFETKIILIDKNDLKNGNLPWIVKIETASSDHEILQFDLVVVATGLFSTPEEPNFRGQNKFAGSIQHIIDIKKEDQLKNKRVIVIGGAKSAIDMATLAAMHANSCHMVFSHSYWILPHKILRGYIPLDYGFSRIFTHIFDPFPNAPRSAAFYFLHRVFSFVFTKISDSIANFLISKYKSDLFADEKFIPKESIRNPHNLMRVTKEFITMIRENRIIRKLASIDEIIDETTIRLDSGEFLQADLIICATGFIETFPFLSETLTKALVKNTTTSKSDEGIDLDLYRRIIPIGIPNIAFIGLPAPIHTWMFYEVQCHWMSDYFLGRIKLPNTEKEMYEEIETTRQFIYKMFKRKSYYFQYYWLEPMEIYLRDMGVSLYRTNNWISEYFGVYRPKRLSTLHDERKAKAEGKTTNIWYFSFQHTILLFLLLLFICFFF